MLIGVVSIWANIEASKGFDITIVNDSPTSVAGKRYALFFVSNDKATRIALNTSKFVEDLLYPDDTHPKKQVNRVTLRMAGRNLIQNVMVESPSENEFVIHLSPSILEDNHYKKTVKNDINHSMLAAIQRGMARVWLYDKAPKGVIDGAVEYISILAGFGDTIDSDDKKSPESKDGCREEDPKAVAQLLNLYEGDKKKGFLIRRLNQAMKDRWGYPTVENGLAMPTQNSLCGHIRFFKPQKVV